MSNPMVCVDGEVREATDEEMARHANDQEPFTPPPPEPVDPVAVVKGVGAISALTTLLMAKQVLTKEEADKIIADLPV
jgi:hypothetical protein